MNDNKEFISVEFLKPPQGQKVIGFRNGDVFITQRFKEHWFAFPFLDSAHRNMIPEKWQYLELPDGYTGKIMVLVEGVLFDIDELEIKHNDLYQKFVDSLIKSYGDKNDKS